MEETNRPGVGEENSEELSVKKRRNWLFRRERPLPLFGEVSAETNEKLQDEEDSTAETPLNKKRRGFFSRLFSRFVSKEAPVGPMPLRAENIAKKTSTEVEKNDPVENTEVESLGEIAEKPGKTEAPNTEVADQPVGNNPLTEAGPTSEARTYPTPAEAVVWQADRREDQSRPELPITNRRYVTPERDGAGIATGLIVDQLSRRRDRKLKRAVAKANKQISRLKEKDRQIEKAIEKNSDELKGELKIIHSETAPAINPETRVEQAPQAIKELKTQTQPETLQTILSEKKQQLERIKSGEPSAEQILKRVVSAAEKNVPLEAVYERRHEVKDESTQDMPGGLAGSAPSFQPPIDLALSPVWPEQKSAAPNTKVASGNGQSLYKQAAISGFWTGVVILAILAAMLILN